MKITDEYGENVCSGLAHVVECVNNTIFDCELSRLTFFFDRRSGKIKEMTFSLSSCSSEKISLEDDKDD